MAPAEEIYIKDNFQSFDVIAFLKKHRLEDLKIAKNKFSTAIGNLTKSESPSISSWAKEVQENNYYLISTTVALEYFIQIKKKRIKLLKELESLEIYRRRGEWRSGVIACRR